MGDQATAVVSGCPLTRRQHQTLLLLMQGCTYKQAAVELGIGFATVRHHANRAYKRLGVSDVRQALAVMVHEGWTEPLDLLPGYTGLPYTTRRAREPTWLPSPAQRLYLDAFDRLLEQRTDAAAEHVDFYFGAMCRERRVRDRRRGHRDIDDMLLSIAVAVTRPIPA